MTLATGRPEKATWKTDYNKAGLLSVETDPLDLQTIYAYDAQQHLASITTKGMDGLEFVEKYTYDTLGYLRSFTDARGDFYTTTYSVDLVGQVLSESGVSGVADNPNPYTIDFTYDPIGNLKTSSDPRDNSFLTTFEYDNVGRRISEEDANGDVVHYAYDETGNLVAVTDPRGGPGDAEFTTIYEYDILNRQTGVQVPGLGMACTVYDAVGNVVAEVDPGAGLATCLNLEVSEGTPYATTYQYNSVGYLTEVTDAEGNRTVYSDHDGVGNVGKITDARGFETAFSYDGLDHVTSITRDIGPLGDQQAVENFQYDALGNLRRSTDARGEEYESRYEYDSHYRLTAFEQELVFNGDDALRSTFGYDQVGN